MLLASEPNEFLQARAADEAGIQFRMLNASKGPAVRGPRAQMDRSLYKGAVQRLLTAQPGLHVCDGAVVDLLLEPGGPCGSRRAAVAGVQLASGAALPLLVMSAPQRLCCIWLRLSPRSCNLDTALPMLGSRALLSL